MTPIPDFKRWFRLAVTSMLTGMGLGVIAVTWRATLAQIGVGTIIFAMVISAFMIAVTIILIRNHRKEGKEK